MTHRLLGGQIYVYAVIALGAVVMASALSSLQFPAARALCRFAGAVGHQFSAEGGHAAGRRRAPASRSPTRSTSPRCSLLGPAPTMLIADHQRLVAVHLPDE